VAEPGEGDRDIGLGAADMDVEPAGLQQQFPPRRGQPEQQFAETDDPSHRRILPVMGRAGKSQLPAAVNPWTAARNLRPTGTSAPVRSECLTEPVLKFHNGSS